MVLSVNGVDLSQKMYRATNTFAMLLLPCFAFVDGGTNMFAYSIIGLLILAFVILRLAGLFYAILHLVNGWQGALSYSRHFRNTNVYPLFSICHWWRCV